MLRHPFVPILLLLCSVLVQCVDAEPGSIDLSFDPGSGVSKNGSATVSAIVVQPDGKILIGGDFTTVNGVSRPRVARLLPSGRLDESFTTGAGPSDAVLAMALQPDGRVLIAGTFTNVNNVGRSRIARLNGDGSLDQSFNPGSGADWDVASLFLQPDGKIVLGGAFSEMDGTPRNALARLESTGKIDEQFTPPFVDEAYIGAIVGQESGRLVVAGQFSTAPGVQQRLGRLTSSGALDSSFQIGAGPDGEVLALQVDNLGRILLGGSFSRLGATPRNRVARLKSDGTVDDTFDPGAGPDADVLAIALQTDGKALIGGNFQQVNGAKKNGVARLQANGAVDGGFNAGVGVQGSVQSLALQRDERLVVGGFISSVDEVPRNGIARLLGDAPQLVDPHWSAAAGFSLSVATEPGKSYVLEFADEVNGVWSELAPVIGDGTVKTLTDRVASGARRFYRVRVSL